MTSSRYPTRNINTTKRKRKEEKKKNTKKRHLTKKPPRTFHQGFFFLIFLISMFLCLIPDSLICPSPCPVAANLIPIRWEVSAVVDVLGSRRGLVYSINLIYDFFLSAASSLSPSIFVASLYMPLDLAAGGTGLRDFVWGSIGQPLQSFLWIVAWLSQPAVPEQPSQPWHLFLFCSVWPPFSGRSVKRLSSLPITLLESNFLDRVCLLGERRRVRSVARW